MGKIAVPEARDLPAIADVVIIGGGIVGTAAAFYFGVPPFFALWPT